MKISLILSFLLIFHISEKETFETYDWSSYKAKSVAVTEALNRVVEAHIILLDTYAVDFDALPNRTKSQLIILQEAAYLEWLVAEEAMGKEEAAKYWAKGEADLGPECYRLWGNDYKDIMPVVYQNISLCNLPTRSDCHMEDLKKLVALDIKFHQCTTEKYGRNMFTFTKR